MNRIRELFGSKQYAAHETGMVRSVLPVFEHSPCPMWIIEPGSFRFLAVNEAAQKLHGYSKAELLNMHLSDVVLPRNGKSIHDIITDRISFETPYSAVHRNKQGQLFNVQVYAQVINYKGQVARLAFIIRDEAAAIAQAQSKDLSDRMEDILESISDGFFTLDKNWTITYVNKAYAELYHSPREHFIGDNFWEHFPTASKQAFYTEYYRAVNDRVNVHFEEYSWYLDKWISVHAYPTDTGLTVYFTDITEQKKYRLQIEAHNNILKEIAWIQSHKVRSPVASILGLTELFDHQNTNPDEMKIIIEGIRSKAKDLDEIIREINDKTRDKDAE